MNENHVSEVNRYAVRRNGTFEIFVSVRIPFPRERKPCPVCMRIWDLPSSMVLYIETQLRPGETVSKKWWICENREVCGFAHPHGQGKWHRLSNGRKKLMAQRIEYLRGGVPIGEERFCVILHLPNGGEARLQMTAVQK